LKSRITDLKHLDIKYSIQDEQLERESGEYAFAYCRHHRHDGHDGYVDEHSCGYWYVIIVFYLLSHKLSRSLPSRTILRSIPLFLLYRP
jgi:hypothetical protein